MEQYTAYLIDPFAQNGTSVNINRGEEELEQIYALTGCELIATATPSFGRPGDRIVIDDEGLFKDEQAFFYADGQRFAGKALYVGTSDSLFQTPDITLEAVMAQVGFNADPFRQWLETFLSEKKIPLDHTFTFDIANGFASITVGAIVDQICISDSGTKKTIKEKIVRIDFCNDDVLHFFNFLGARIAGRG